MNKDLVELFKKLKQLDSYKFFWYPIVPTKATKDYYRKIQNPMDFECMEEKLKNGVYRNIELFKYDFVLLCSNAKMYYPIQSRYYRMASRLEDEGIQLIAAYLDRCCFIVKADSEDKITEDLVDSAVDSAGDGTPSHRVVNTCVGQKGFTTDSIKDNAAVVNFGTVESEDTVGGEILKMNESNGDDREECRDSVSGLRGLMLQKQNSRNEHEGRLVGLINGFQRVEATEQQGGDDHIVVVVEDSQRSMVEESPVDFGSSGPIEEFPMTISQETSNSKKIEEVNTPNFGLGLLFSEDVYEDVKIVDVQQNSSHLKNKSENDTCSKQHAECESHEHSYAESSSAEIDYDNRNYGRLKFSPRKCSSSGQVNKEFNDLDVQDKISNESCSASLDATDVENKVEKANELYSPPIVLLKKRKIAKTEKIHSIPKWDSNELDAYGITASQCFHDSPPASALKNDKNTTPKDKSDIGTDTSMSINEFVRMQEVQSKKDTDDDAKSDISDIVHYNKPIHDTHKQRRKTLPMPKVRTNHQSKNSENTWLYPKRKARSTVKKDKGKQAISPFSRQTYMHQYQKPTYS